MLKKCKYCEGVLTWKKWFTTVFRIVVSHFQTTFTNP